MVSLAPGAADSDWRIALENMGSLPVERVRYPRIAAIRPIAQPGATDALAVPRWMGALAHDARALLAGKDGRAQAPQALDPSSQVERGAGAERRALSFRQALDPW